MGDRRSVVNYWFLPFSRRGAGTLMAGDGNGNGRGVATVEVTGSVTDSGGKSQSLSHVQGVPVLGPGDVTGLDPSQVIRMTPVPGDLVAEPNYLAAVEFAHPDLPWMFSPDGSEPIRPWLALVVVEDEDGTRVRTRPGSPNPFLVASPGELPHPDELWAWAHVQVVANGAAEIDTNLVTSSQWGGHARSRLLAPRRFEATRKYVACVVPTFEAGRRAGLRARRGEQSPGGSAPAWTRGGGDVTLPVYRHWRFATGPEGDFETLARRLHKSEPQEIEAVGMRRVLVDPIRSRIQPPQGSPSLFESYVARMPTAITTAEGSTRQPEVEGGAASILADLLDLPEKMREAPGGADRPAVGPPIYGQWHAETRRVVPQAGAPPVPQWVTELNLDPALRVAAGAGSHVVVTDQEQLMASAWEQLDDVMAANRRRRWGQLFLHAAQHLYASRVIARTDGSLLQLAHPALSRLRIQDEGNTLTAVVRTSPMPPLTLSASFTRTSRRLTRPVAGAATASVLGAIAAPLLRGEVSIVPDRLADRPHRLPIERLTAFLDGVGLAAAVEESTGLSLEKYVHGVESLRTAIEQADADLQAHPPTVVQPVEGVIRRYRGGTEPAWARVMRARVDTRIEEGGADWSVRIRQDVNHLLDAPTDAKVDVSAETMAALLQLADEGTLDLHEFEGRVRVDRNRLGTFVLRNLKETETVEQSVLTSQARVSALLGEARSRFNLDDDVPSVLTELDPARVSAIVGQVGAGIDAVTPPSDRRQVPSFRAVAVNDVRDAVVTGLDPSARYLQMLSWLIEVKPGPRKRKPTRPIMAAPTFPDPFVDRLTRLDRDWVLGNAGALPPDSITVFFANRRFVESALAGANHEMARELLWRGYPTDQMGTCFARFWPTAPTLIGASGPDDTDQMHLWGDRLGANPAGRAAVDDGDAGTFVVIRGELLRRYPNTLVAAVFGSVDGTGNFVHDSGHPDGGVAYELFRGTLPEDITYVALAITRRQLQETTGSKSWYIALTQPLEEPRFGLDEEPEDLERQPQEPNDLSWKWIGDTGLVADNHIVLGGRPQSVPGWMSDWWDDESPAAAVAAGLLQMPFQLFLPATEYL